MRLCTAEIDVLRGGGVLTFDRNLHSKPGVLYDEHAPVKISGRLNLLPHHALDARRGMVRMFYVQVVIRAHAHLLTHKYLWVGSETPVFSRVEASACECDAS